jgi:hypothetical protein
MRLEEEGSDGKRVLVLFIDAMDESIDEKDSS